MPVIEKDALKNTPDALQGASFVSGTGGTGGASIQSFVWDTMTGRAVETHTHEVKSFIATPRQDTTLMERFRSLFKSELKPGQYITKGADGLRYMFLITSNSYEDRDDETVTSKALEHYEASCYPGENLFHCDNPLLWWHDDDVPMGEIIAVNYSKPFLVEVAKELPSPTARILWDYAEQNGDRAGVSQRFGYRDEDRKPDGSFTQIFKQETSYLPERSLAANTMTAIGVIDKNMSTKQSDAWLNKIFSEATGGKIQEAAAKIHAKSGELDKELAALGITHKAKADVPPEDEPKLDAEGNPVEAPEEEQKQSIPAEFMKWIEQLMQIQSLVLQMSGDQGGLMDAQVEMAKMLKAFQDERVKAKAASDTLEQRLAALEAWRKLTPRSVGRDAPATDIEKLTKSLETAQIQAADAELVDSPVGKIKPPIKYDT
jgi:hypothetical protein